MALEMSWQQDASLPAGDTKLVVSCISGEKPQAQSPYQGTGCEGRQTPYLSSSFPLENSIMERIRF